MKRKFSGFDFERVGDIDPERDLDGKIRESIPESVPSGSGKSQAASYLRGPFCHFHISTNFPYPGVYVITVDGDVKYINECQNLSERFNSLGYGVIYPQNAFFTDKLTKCHINRVILEDARQNKTIELWFLRNLRERREIKDQLVKQHQPEWNQQLSKLS